MMANRDSNTVVTQLFCERKRCVYVVKYVDPTKGYERALLLFFRMERENDASTKQHMYRSLEDKG